MITRSHRRHPLQLFKLPHGSLASRTRLSHRALNAWNELPKEIVCARDFAQFKVKLLRWIQDNAILGRDYL